MTDSILDVLMITQHAADLDETSQATLTRRDFIGKSPLPRRGMQSTMAVNLSRSEHLVAAVLHRNTESERPDRQKHPFTIMLLDTSQKIHQQMAMQYRKWNMKALTCMREYQRSWR
jgi:hypothetical protein